MRALIQRVNHASVTIENKKVSQINKGLLIFLGMGENDTEAELDKIWNKISKMRIFEDDEGKTDLSAKDIEGFNLLVVSQFTLYASMKKGNRPSFTPAAKPNLANDLYEKFIERARVDFPDVKTGEFGAYMQVELENDGPFTLWLDSADL